MLIPLRYIYTFQEHQWAASDVLVVKFGGGLLVISASREYSAFTPNGCFIRFGHREARK